MLEVMDRESAGLVVQADLSALQAPCRRVRRADGQQNASRRVRTRRCLPGDVEIAGVRRGGSVFQHVVPPDVFVADDAHVVGHDVEDLAEVVLAQGVDEGGVIGVVADLGIEMLMIQNVVAVLAAGPGFQVGRGIDSGVMPRSCR